MTAIHRSLTAAASLAVLAFATGALAQTPAWMNTRLSPDERARLLDAELTLDERIGLVHGPMAMPYKIKEIPKAAIGSAGYIPGVPRLGIPALQESDASLGVTNPMGMRPGDGATALPSGLSLASTFDPRIAYAGGALVGREARAKGFNVQLAGGVNLARDPRNGRNFEYLGEDPLLAGVLAGESIRGIQDQKIVSTVKHFSLNGQETNRHWANSVIDEAARSALEEHAARMAVVPVEVGWSDIGSWDALHEIEAQDDSANALHGDVLALESHGCLIRTSGPSSTSEASSAPARNSSSRSNACPKRSRRASCARSTAGTAS